MSDNMLNVAEGEVVIRKYNITEVPRPRPDGTTPSTTEDVFGTLFVTNKRVVYDIDKRDRSNGVKSASHTSKEMWIKDIKGVTFSSQNSKPSNTKPIVFIVLGVLTVFIIVGIVLIVLGVKELHKNSQYRPSMKFSINSVDSKEKNITRWCMPNEQSDALSRELGAIILDIQNDEATAIEKWSN